MARFRCPRCGAVVEGLHDRCPRCKVLFKYRKEDIDLLTPYKSQGPEVPELIEEKKVEEPLPPVQEPAPEPAPVEEPAPQEEVKEEPEVEMVEKTEVVKRIDLKPMKKAKTRAFVFGLLGFFFCWVLSGILGIVFGAVALGQAKKAKPLKATGGKAWGIIDIILGILILLGTIAFVLFLIAALATGGVLAWLYWPEISEALGLTTAMMLL